MKHSESIAIAGAEPGFFGPAERPLFAWLHRAAQPATDVGLVIVPPFGFEAVYAQRAMRHLAEDAAKAGLIAIRVDLDGSGDSAGDDLDPGRHAAWLASIDDACALALSAGATRLVLVGIRLGAALALQAAVRRADIAGYVAIAAVVNGKAWLREGRALQMALGLPPPPATTVNGDVQELVGFALTAETRADVSRIDLTDIPARPAPAVMVIDRDDLPGNDAWVAHLRALGAEVDHRTLPGYVEMMLEPHRTEVPQAIIDATVAFAIAQCATSHTPATQPSAREIAGAAAATAGLARRVEMPFAGGHIAEEAVQVDDHLFGIVARPLAGAPTRAVIVLNAGAVGRVGPNRMHVVVARKLAQQGHLALRLDLAGIGDGAAHAGAPENVVYGEQAVADVGAAVAWVHALGIGEIAVAGLCSGAYHALEAAVAVHSIDRVVVINPLTFKYIPGMPLDFAAFRVIADAQRYGVSARSAASWKKLLRGDVDLRRVAGVIIGRMRGMLGHGIGNVLRWSGVRMQDDLGSKLLALGARGVAVHFIFAASDPGHELLLEQGGSAVTQLAHAGGLSITVIDGADHTFTPLWTHPLLVDAIVQALAVLTGA
ncbi:MAG: hypothetical protein ACOH1R_06650 [Luteimonas sp.]